ncbi:hypothetical protein HN011_006906 [Eciton burchellii]|nr:hypothetical protein HN011_006906 [Eciton burchellii]
MLVLASAASAAVELAPINLTDRFQRMSDLSVHATRDASCIQGVSAVIDEHLAERFPVDRIKIDDLRGPRRSQVVQSAAKLTRMRIRESWRFAEIARDRAKSYEVQARFKQDAAVKIDRRSVILIAESSMCRPARSPLGLKVVVVIP